MVAAFNQGRGWERREEEGREGFIFLVRKIFREVDGDDEFTLGVYNKSYLKRNFTRILFFPITK